jgi:undecaprenyl diphosphate synthase
VSGALPRHVAIIMDGNGRWATRRGLPRAQGHLAGAEAVRRTVRAAREIGLDVLTLYAFSTQNWSRPTAEVTALMELLCRFLASERAELVARGIRLAAIGDRARLPASTRAVLSAVTRATSANRGMTLCLALSYGGRDAIVAAARKLACDASEGRIRANAIDEARFGDALDSHFLPPPDLIIRTSGEKRLSNFLLWEAAYAELYFTDLLWPDFSRADLELALGAYTDRHRRYGRVAVS